MAAVTSAILAGVAVAVAASGTGYAISENEDAKDQAKKQRRKAEQDAAKVVADLEAEKVASRNKEIQAASLAANISNRKAEFNPSGIQGTVTAAADGGGLASVIGSSSGNMRTLIGG